MMPCRERASVEEGKVGGRRVGEGNERGRDETRHGRREGKREEASGGKIEGEWEEVREGNFKGGSIFSNQPFTNRPLLLGLQY